MRDAEPEQAHLASASVLCWARTRPQVGGASAVIMRDIILSCMERINTCDPAFASKAPEAGDTNHATCSAGFTGCVPVLVMHRPLNRNEALKTCIL